jgi:hypothetical protein
VIVRCNIVAVQHKVENAICQDKFVRRTKNVVLSSSLAVLFVGAYINYFNNNELYEVKFIDMQTELVTCRPFYSL